MIKTTRIAGALALGLSLAGCGSAPTPSAQTIGEALAATQPGQFVLTWARGLAANAKASLAKLTAGGGLSQSDIANLCAMDNTAHSAVQLVELIPVIPATVAPLDNAAHAAIQGACQVAQGGALPSLADLSSIAGEAQALIGDLKL